MHHTITKIPYIRHILICVLSLYFFCFVLFYPFIYFNFCYCIELKSNCSPLREHKLMIVLPKQTFFTALIRIVNYSEYTKLFKERCVYPYVSGMGIQRKTSDSRKYLKFRYFGQMKLLVTWYKLVIYLLTDATQIVPNIMPVVRYLLGCKRVLCNFFQRVCFLFVSIVY